ncbi:MAG: DJ-1/PfpI family protein [Clostridia bacterium]|nr:DJ-1/PfpI family protein [Clostridia bacterium]
MIIVLLANGFEEIEALTPVDMLKRAGLTVKTVSIAEKTVTGSHGIAVVADMTYDEFDFTTDVELVIFPGGMPGSLNLDGSEFVNKIIAKANKDGARLAAICAAPLILGRRGLLNGKRATCYPGFENELRGALTTGDAVVTDGLITTARGMGVALEFSKELISLMLSADKASELSAQIME